MNKKRVSSSAIDWLLIGIVLIVIGVLFYLATIGHEKLLIYALVGICLIGLIWGFVAGGFLVALGVLVAEWLIMKVIDYVMKPVAFILILGGVVCIIVSFSTGVIDFFRKIKEGREKDRAREAEIANLPNRSLDGTYKIVMIHHSPNDRNYTPKELNMEEAELILSGNRFEINDYPMHETGTFSVEKNGSLEKITFYAIGDELFGTGVVNRGRNYTDIKKLNIVDKHYRLSPYEFTYTQEYGK